MSYLNWHLTLFVCAGSKSEEESWQTRKRWWAIRTNMKLDRLGKWLFPRWQPYRQRREVRTILAALGVGLIVAAVISAIIILANSASLGR
jgi:hypothetical protein